MKKPYNFDQAQKDALKNGPTPTPGKIDQKSVDWVTSNMLGKSTEELMFGAENRELVTQAIEAAVARADAAGLPPAYEPYLSMSKTMPVEEVLKLRRRDMVAQVNANQRLEGYEPDEQLKQLQERFIAGELATSKMIEILIDYARKVRKVPNIGSK